MVCPSAEAASAPHAAPFALTSTALQSGSIVPAANVGARNGCHGLNQSPPLAWAHPPAGTQGYAVSMADLDARVGAVWLWLMFDIPGKSAGLPANAAAFPGALPPGAAQARNGFGEKGYSGPCPTRGKIAHHYLVTVWALGESHLPFADGAPAETIAVYLRRHALGHASLTPHYGRH